MGYDLIPRNKKQDSFSMGAFSWSWMLDSGVGLVLGQGKSIKPGSYRYVSDKKGYSPCSNDGYYVTSKQAKIMAYVARGLVSVERGKSEEWEQVSEEEKSRIEGWSMGNSIYNLPVREDFINKAEEFANWAEKSGGFNIR